MPRILSGHRTLTSAFNKASELFPWQRQSPAVAIQASCSFKIPMTCSSLNLLRFVVVRLFRVGLHEKRSYFRAPALLFLATNSNQLNEAGPSVALGLQILKRAAIHGPSSRMARKKLRQKPRPRLFKRHLSRRSSLTKEMQLASARERVREYLDDSGAIIMCE